MATSSSNLPTFSPEYQRQLRAFGLIDEQIAALRYALLSVKRTIAPQPAKNASLEILSDIRKMSDALSLKLNALLVQPTLAHHHVHGELEKRYWQQRGRKKDDGATIPNHLIPRLFALSVAAEMAIDDLPTGATRVRSADPEPIGRIETALIVGWLEGHRKRSQNFSDDVSQRDAAHPLDLQAPAPPYPESLRRSAAEDSAFRAIVGICYQTVGGTHDPLAALKAFISLGKASDADALAALEEGLAEADQDSEQAGELPLDTETVPKPKG